MLTVSYHHINNTGILQMTPCSDIAAIAFDVSW